MRKAFSLSTLIAVAIMSLLALFVIITSIIMSIFYTRTVEESAVSSTEEFVRQLNNNVDYYISDITDVADYARNLARTSTNLSADDIRIRLEALIAARDDLVRVAIFTKDGETIVSTGPGEIDRDYVLSELWFQRAVAGEGDFFFTGPHKESFSPSDALVLSYSQIINYADAATDSTQAVLLIDLNFNAIQEISDSAAFAANGYIYFISNDGELIYHPYGNEIESGTFSEDLAIVEDTVWGTVISEFEGRSRLTVIMTVNQTRWRIVGVAYMDELLGGYNIFRVLILVLSVFLILLSIPVANIIAKRLTLPIRRLEQEMKKVQEGDFDISPPSGGSAEVQSLSSSFMLMVSRTEELMKRIKTTEAVKRQRELDALQAKINPHFLYNTLDSVIWMAETGDNEGVVRMVSSLARLFRISIAKGRDIITLREELQHVRSYMDIQSMRYKDKFTYSITLPDELQEAPVIKLIIQPIVENSIYHGIKMLQDEGRIDIEAHSDGSTLWIRVSDNGVGMTDERLRSILDRSADHQHKEGGNGIGMLNIDERIKLTYGEEYGLEIESELDAGTTVTVKLPRGEDIRPVVISS